MYVSGLYTTTPVSSNLQELAVFPCAMQQPTEKHHQEGTYMVTDPPVPASSCTMPVRCAPPEVKSLPRGLVEETREPSSGFVPSVGIHVPM